MLKGLNLIFAFILELCMLLAFAYWGFNSGLASPLQIIVGLGLPLLAIVVWGYFLAPRSAHRLYGGRYVLLKALLFGLAGLALVGAGQSTLAIIFLVAAVINHMLANYWQQE